MKILYFIYTLMTLFLLAMVFSMGASAQNLKISQLPTASTPLSGGELVPIVQGGVTKQTTVSAIGTATTLTDSATIAKWGLKISRGTTYVALSVDSGKVGSRRWVDSLFGTITGTGTVTSVGSGFGIQGGPITSSGTLKIDTVRGRKVGIPTIYFVDSIVAASGSVYDTVTRAGIATIVRRGSGTNIYVDVDTITGGKNIATQGYVTRKGYLTSAVTSVATTSPITGGTITGTGTIGITQATTSTNGYLSSTDWNTFNNKGVGSVTSITAGTGLSGGTITGSGTIAISNTAVSPASYGSSTVIPNFTVNQQGQLTNAGTSNIALTVGTVQVTSGTNKYLLYDKNGILGDTALSGGSSFDTTFAAGYALKIGRTSGLITYKFDSSVTFKHLHIDTINSPSYLALNTNGNQVIVGGGATEGKNLNVTGSTYTYTMQIAYGAANGYILSSDASGNASWSLGQIGSMDTVRSRGIGVPSIYYVDSLFATGGGGGAPVYGATLIPFGDGSTAGGVTDNSLAYNLGSQEFIVGTNTGTVMEAYWSNGASSVVLLGDINGNGNSNLFNLNDNSNSIILQSPTGVISLAAAQVQITNPIFGVNNISYSWTGTQGAANTVLTNDGSGNLSWSTVPGSVVDSFSALAQTTSLPTFISYTNPDPSGSHTYEILATIVTGTLTDATLTLQTNFVDENGNSQNRYLIYLQGSGAGSNTVTGSNGYYPYIPMTVRLSGSQTMSLSTTLLSGSLTYDISIAIKFIN